MSRTGARNSRPLMLLALTLVVIWLAALAPRHLAKTDEGRYAEISREMVVTGDWLTPRLDGIKYFEKPALQYWADALAERTFGFNEWSARLWTGLAGLFGLGAVGWAALRVYGRATAIASIAILSSSMLYLLMGHVDTLDMGLTAFMTATLASILVSQFSGKPQPRWVTLLAWACAALAVLSKGLIGLVLPGAVLVLYIGFYRDWRMFLRLHLFSGTLVFLAIAAPWFIAVSLANPGFAHFFFIHEHVERFLTHEHNRVGPWWYFVPILAIGLVPWISLLPQAIGHALARPVADPTLARQHQADFFLLLYAAFIFLFFSASGSKLPSYILPVVPALAILLARAVRTARLANLVWHARFVALSAVCGALLGVVAGHLAAHADEIAAYTQFGHALALGCALLFCAALAAARVFDTGQRQRAVLILSAGALMCGFIGLCGYDALDKDASAKYVADQILPKIGPDTPVYSIEMYEQTLPFYLQRTVILVAHRDELDFGLTEEPGLWIPSLEAFATAWREDLTAVAVMPPSTLDKLRAMHLPFTIVLADRRFVVIEK